MLKGVFSQVEDALEIFLFNFQAVYLGIQYKSVAELIMKFSVGSQFFSLFPVKNSVQNSVNFSTMLNF